MLRNIKFPVYVLHIIIDKEENKTSADTVVDTMESPRPIL